MRSDLFPSGKGDGKRDEGGGVGAEVARPKRGGDRRKGQLTIGPPAFRTNQQRQVARRGHRGQSLRRVADEHDRILLGTEHGIERRRRRDLWNPQPARQHGGFAADGVPAFETCTAPDAAVGLKNDEGISAGLGATRQNQFKRWCRKVGDRDGDPRDRLRMVRPLSDDQALDSVYGNRFKTHIQQETCRVDDFNLFTFSNPQRAREVAGISAFDYGSSAFTPSKKRRQLSASHDVESFVDGNLRAAFDDRTSLGHLGRSLQ